jgi:LytS/YehU family sensor histidine kinase
MVGFIISLGLRMYYKHFFKSNSNILSAAILIISGSLAAALLWQFIGDFVRHYLIFPSNYEPSYSPGKFILRIYMLLWVYLVWSILYFGLKFWVNMVEEKIRAGKADADTRRAQLQMLRYQINPHFLFNTLNSIKALMRRETVVAENMITEFSEFLRYSLRHNDKTFISLEEEIEIVKKYLLLEKIRFEKRLVYSFENTAESLKVPVLCFLLQPFVENAIKHGLKISPSGIELYIRSFIKNNELHLEIENTGRWITESDESGTGIRNVTDRLATAYPGNHTFNIEKGAESVLVTITIDLKK